MKKYNPVSVIPTYRLRDVGETIERYDEHFWNNGHTIKIIVFDDSSITNFNKYYRKLEQTKTYNDVYYVGPHEKGEFTSILLKRLSDKKLEPLVNNLFRPSYGGNRNFTLIYTLGSLMISSDDDMRPEGLIHNHMESLLKNEISKGRLLTAEHNSYSVKSYDLLSSFLDVLGKRAKDIPGNYDKGELLIDTSMDLETNSTKGLAEENSLILQEGKVSNNSVIKIAQSFRTGTNDIDALDFADIFLKNETQININDLNEVYVLINFRPVVTNKNWRMDCGVAGYDNTHGLPPFFPTRLRFEDFIYRLWMQQNEIASAHVNSVQRHIKNNYMREPLASDILNEELANLLKRKIKSSQYKLNELNISFGYDGSVTSQDSEEILEKILKLYNRITDSAEKTKIEERKKSLNAFASNLNRVFYGFEPDFFQQNVSRIVDDEIGLIKSSMEIWQALIEICYFYKSKKELPQTKIKNKKKQ